MDLLMDNSIDVLENELLLSQIAGELNLKRKLLDETRRALTESQSARHDLEQELDSQKHHVAELRSKLDLAVATLRQCEQDAAGSTGKDTRLECAERERDAFKERVRILQQKNDEMQSQLNELRNRVNSNEIMKRGLYEQMEKFQHKMSTVNEYIVNHEADEDTLRKDISASKTMTKMLQSMVKYYKDLHQKSLTEKQSFMNNITALTAEVQTLKMQNKSTILNCAMDNEINTDLRKSIAHLQEMLQKEKETVTRLTIQTEQQNRRSLKQIQENLTSK